MTPPFPFTALVGQDELVDALLVNAVAPEVGGLLVRGERGTAKSTAARGLAPLLPAVAVAEAGPFPFAPGDRAWTGPIDRDAQARQAKPPMVELPLGATLDRLVGALDLGRALAGEHAFEPGLLARAHQGILYVDEVNLLPDHLVDALLDAAASGIVRVERDAVSVEHDARFLLVGTMNAEEGELRPQLLDRFGLGVEVSAPRDAATRAEIVRRRLEFEQDPARFRRRFEDRERELAAGLAAARDRLADVRLPERQLLRISAACARLEIDGVRGDITCARAARALAALDSAAEVEEEHIRRAAVLALAHRRRRDPLDGASGAPDEELQRAFDETPPDDPSPGGGARPRQQKGEPSSGQSGNGDGKHGAPSPEPAPATVSDAVAAPRLDAPVGSRLTGHVLTLRDPGAGPAGRRAPSSGPAAGSIDSRPVVCGREDVALIPTLVARLAGNGGEVRRHVRAGREGALLCLVVDTSGSMGARRRLARVKGALLELLRDAYARRDRVMVLAFHGEGVELLVRPGAPVEAAAAAVRGLPTGGTTPLAAGLSGAAAEVRRAAVREPGRRAIAVVFTDGRVADDDGRARAAAAALGRASAALHVVDTEDGHVRVGLAREIARAGGGIVHQLTPIETRRAA